MKKISYRAISISVVFFFLLISSLTLFFFERGESQLSYFKNENSVNPFKGLFPNGRQVSTPEWERENVFINDNIYLRQSGGYELTDNVKVPTILNPNPIKILIFGDSYTWGNGFLDPYATITGQIQHQLDIKAGKGIYQIEVLAKNGTSTFSHYDHFKINNISKYKADMVIYNYFNNDIDPSFTESLICRSLSVQECQSTQGPKLNPAYQSCMHGEGDFVSAFLGRFKLRIPNTTKNLLDRYCDPLYQKAVSLTYNPIEAVHHPLNSIYFPVWKRAVSMLSAELSGPKLFVADIRDPSVDRNEELAMMAEFRNNGFEVIPMNSTDKFIYQGDKTGEYFAKEMFVNPGNTHTASNINYLYAQDISDFILKNTPDNLLSRAKSSLGVDPEREQLITHTLPYFDLSNISLTPNQSRVVFNKKAEELYPQRSSSNNDLPFQYNNCMNLGYSNFILNLDSRINKGSLSLSNLPRGVRIETGFYYYDGNMKLKYQNNGTYKDGSLIKLPSSKYNTSLVIAFPDYGVNCSADRVIEAPDFNILINYSEL